MRKCCSCCSRSEPSKPSKSALKKAAKAARTEKRQQQKVAKRTSDNSLGESATEPPDRPITDYEPIKVLQESYEIIPVTPRLNGPTQKVPNDALLQPPATLSQAQAVRDVHTILSSPERSYPTSMETSGRNSPEPLDELNTNKHLHGDPLNEELQLALQNKLRQQQVAERFKKKQNAITRTLWTFIMIGGFIGMLQPFYVSLVNSENSSTVLLFMGHAYMVILVMLCQTLVYREVTALFSLKDTTPQSGEVEHRNKNDPWSKTLNWYFFAVTNYFLYGESIIYYFKVPFILFPFKL